MLLCTTFCSKVRSFGYFCCILGTVLPPFFAHECNSPIISTLSASPPAPISKIPSQEPIFRLFSVLDFRFWSFGLVRRGRICFRLRSPCSLRRSSIGFACTRLRTDFRRIKFHVSCFLCHSPTHILTCNPMGRRLPSDISYPRH